MAHPNLRFRDWLHGFTSSFGSAIPAAIATLVVTALATWLTPLGGMAKTWLSQRTDLSFVTLGVALLLALVLGGLAAYLLMKRRLNEMLDLVGMDELTGLYNNRELRRRLIQEISHADRYDSPLSVMLIDLDGFKSVNDRFSYDAGDSVLREFAGLLQRELRETEVAFRFKLGDEFVVLMSGTELLNARIPAERLRGRVESYHFSHPNGPDDLQVTISAGVAQLQIAADAIEGIQIQDGDRGSVVNDAADALLKRAEILLTQAKQTKNTVVVADT